MTNPVLSSREQRILDLLPLDGTALGNRRMMELLGWTERTYWPARDALVAKDLIARGRGGGGTVRRVVILNVGVVDSSSQTATTSVGAGSKRVYLQELDLYPPAKDILAKEWPRERGSNPLFVEITASQGKRITGGVWSRPDLVSAEVKAYEYVPGKFLEVVSFEVKPSTAIDVQAVYEALAHRRASTHAWVILHVPTPKAAALEESIQSVVTAARMHGVGVIVMADPADFDTWETIEEAQRFGTDPERLNGFISTQLCDSSKRAIARALR